MWVVKEFSELSLDELVEIYKLRVSIFVVEQKCAYQEIDDKDKLSTHIFKIKDNKIVAYARVVNAQNKVYLGRVVVAPSQRKSGTGKELVAKAVEIAKSKHKGTKESFKLHAQAQAHLTKFYGSFGFVCVSDVYLVDDIPHVDMILSENLQKG